MREPRWLFQLPWRSARRIRDEFEEELAFHYDMRVEELAEHGVPIEEARARAAREFGDLDDARRYVRRIDHSAETANRRRDLVRDALQEFSDALRRLRRSP